MKFYDAHSHRLLAQSGGFLIGLEGKPFFPDALTNDGAFALENRTRLLFAVEYVAAGTLRGSRPLLKYHPCRERYPPEFVSDSIRRSEPRLCIIDTLNQPYWRPLDYWSIARSYPDIQFVFCHAGGYDILDFLKMADFTPNVWLDFSLTQEYFGWTGQRPRLRHVTASRSRPAHAPTSTSAACACWPRSTRSPRRATPRSPPCRLRGSAHSRPWYRDLGPEAS